MLLSDGDERDGVSFVPTFIVIEYDGDRSSEISVEQGSHKLPRWRPWILRMRWLWSGSTLPIQTSECTTAGASGRPLQPLLFFGVALPGVRGASAH